MSKDLRPPFDWVAVQGCFDRPIYDAIRLRELFLSVEPPRDALHSLQAAELALRELTAGFAFDRWLEAQPSASREEVEARRLAEACRRVLSTAGLGDAEPSADTVHPFFGAGGLYAAASVTGIDNHKPQDYERLARELRGRWVNLEASEYRHSREPGLFSSDTIAGIGRRMRLEDQKRAHVFGSVRVRHGDFGRMMDKGQVEQMIRDTEARFRNKGRRKR